jgi:DNA helicase-2/ATP-dependent DNA helicase PcrA
MRNQGRKDKKIETPNKAGSAVQWVRAIGEREEANFVASTTKTLIQNKITPSNIAVLYRIASLSSDLESAFLRAGIKYEVVRGTRYVDRKIVRDALAYINSVVLPEDEISLRRIVNVPRRGFGEATLDSLARAGIDAEITLREAIERGAAGSIALSPKARAAATDLVDTLKNIKAALTKRTLVDQVKGMIEATGLLDNSPAEDAKDQDSAGDLMKLVDIAASLVEDNPQATITDFLDYLALQSEADDKTEDSQQKVKLLTIHASKGLEFHTVFLVGMEDGILPHSRALLSQRKDNLDAEMEEERRLAYVAMTRAKNNLFLTSVSQRRVFGEKKTTVTSKFLHEIPDYLIKKVRV